ncbi:MAG: 6-phosphofructokinase [Clostridia bacterium]|nr:6-phosphofructokinase [Clostridia bacterium]
MGKNAIVGQSGGPTSVINASLAGVIQASLRRDATHVYGMLHGIQGLLDKQYCDLTDRFSSALAIELLKRTPSSFLGSCRYKLPDPEEDPEVFEKLFAILREMDIGWFFYIGGNDSMDTICKLATYGAKTGSDIRFMGVPKTIDNDLMLTDHTPGYGSAAKYIGVTMKEIIRDATVYGTNFVTIVEIMGRNAGWLTAAAALARGEDCEGVDLICLPELPFHTDRFLAKVEKMQKERASVVIAVSEGVKLPDGRFVCELSDDHRTRDAFGHINLNGTARYLSNLVARNLPTRTRPVELSILQRCGGHLASRTDITEAYQVGGAAAKSAFEGESGKMVALHRVSNDPYQCTTRLVDIRDVANFEKKIPVEWINEARTDMLPEFLAYARPLIQAELTPIYIDGLTQHIVEG